jgi:hypothetical protein
MRIIRNLLATLVVLASIVFGAVAAVKNPPSLFPMPEELTKLADQGIQLVGGPDLVFFTCLGLAISGLLTVALTFVGGNRHKDIRVDLDGGSVVMSESAIRSYLETAMQEFPEIGIRRIDIFTGGRGLLIQMQADLRTQDHVPDLEQSIITRIHVALVKELGISKVDKVQVSVAGFRPSPPVAKTASKTIEQPKAAVSAVAAAPKAPLAVEPAKGDAKPMSAQDSAPKAP